MYKTMKIKNIVAALAISVAVLAGCKKTDPVLVGLMAQWHHTAEEADIWLDLESDGGFALYQKLGDSPYVVYKGVWTYVDGVLSGSYIEEVKTDTEAEAGDGAGTDTKADAVPEAGDGTGTEPVYHPWGSKYKVELDGTSVPATLTLTALNASEERITYTRATIPSEIIRNAREPYSLNTAKSGSIDSPIL